MVLLPLFTPTWTIIEWDSQLDCILFAISTSLAPLYEYSMCTSPHDRVQRLSTFALSASACLRCQVVQTGRAVWAREEPAGRHDQPGGFAGSHAAPNHPARPRVHGPAFCQRPLDAHRLPSPEHHQELLATNWFIFKAIGYPFGRVSSQCIPFLFFYFHCFIVSFYVVLIEVYRGRKRRWNVLVTFIHIKMVFVISRHACWIQY